MKQASTNMYPMFGCEKYILVILTVHSAHIQRRDGYILFVSPPKIGEHYNNVIMGALVHLITSLTIIYSSVYSGADQR